MVRSGWGEIRTRDTVSRAHAFQACALSHSATHPRCCKIDHLHESRQSFSTYHGVSLVGRDWLLEEEAMKEKPGYGDAEAKRIIERAAEIDAEQGRRLDAPALREIAAEAGISPLAVDRAFQEYESTPAPTRVPWLKRHRALLSIAAIVLGLLLYFFARLVPPAQ
jgi:hypothetical protein